MQGAVTTFIHSSYRDAYLGPQPVPTWVITEDAAQQIERGVLKTGKEADVPWWSAGSATAATC